MKIIARAHSKWTGNTWDVASAIPKSTANEDGSVKLSFKTNQITLTGQFNMEIVLSKEEIEKIYNQSIREPDRLRISKLEKEIEKISKKIFGV